MNEALRVNNQHSKTANHRSRAADHELRMIAWELTRSCNLACVHCRASAERGPYPGELSTIEVFKVMDEIARVGKPVITNFSK